MEDSIVMNASTGGPNGSNSTSSVAGEYDSSRSFIASIQRMRDATYKATSTLEEQFMNGLSDGLASQQAILSSALEELTTNLKEVQSVISDMEGDSVALTRKVEAIQGTKEQIVNSEVAWRSARHFYAHAGRYEDVRAACARVKLYRVADDAETLDLKFDVSPASESEFPEYELGEDDASGPEEDIF